MVTLTQKYILPGATVAADLPSRAASLVWTVYDTAGRPIRQHRETDVPAGVKRWTWDGRNESGERVGMGLYLVSVTADMEGGGEFSIGVRNPGVSYTLVTWTQVPGPPADGREGEGQKGLLNDLPKWLWILLLWILMKGAS